MADILVRYPNKKYRMWNTVVDQWISKTMSRDAAHRFITGSSYYNCDDAQANDWIDRKGYTRNHLKWLHDCFDSQIIELTKTHKRNKRQWR